MSKQDRQGVRRASDIEQKYNLAGIKRLEKNSDEQSLKFSNFVSENNDKLNEIEGQIYPTGSIYMTISTTDPAEVFGGTWELVGQGYIVVGQDSEDLPQLYQATDICYIWKRNN